MEGGPEYTVPVGEITIQDVPASGPTGFDLDRCTDRARLALFLRVQGPLLVFVHKVLDLFLDLDQVA